jgi:hypothetical protein
MVALGSLAIDKRFIGVTIQHYKPELRMMTFPFKQMSTWDSIFNG